ncbi:MAG TPA: protein translocase subunit SecD [Gemmatimonadaceae bacterium]|nr:protein translocase subunit SecD [Gemmatimonadaceae bacterium]
MSSNIRYRLLTILVLVAASIWALFPRMVTVRERDPHTGQFVEHKERLVPLKKGLDLAGGIHLALEVDESKGVVADKSEAIDRALKIVRTRIDQFGVTEPVVQKVGNDRIIVELPGMSDAARAEALVQQSGFLQFQITDKTNALDKVLPRIDQILKQKGAGRTQGAPVTGGDTAKSTAITGLFAPSTDTSKAKSDTGKAAKKDSAAADTGLLATTGGAFSKLIQPGSIPGEYYVAKTDMPTVQNYLAMPEVQAVLPPGKTILWGNQDESVGNQTYRAFYVLDSRAIMTGKDLIDAKPATDPLEGNVVSFTLDNEGGRRFRNETAKHIGDYMAIVLDNLVMGRPPVIQSAIGTRGQITMRGQPLQAAQDLALVLRAGALPVPLKVVQAQQIGASLGQDSIRDGMHAGILGVALVVLVMIGYYRLSGALAVGALTLYVLFTMALLAGFGASLTLPGLAGLVLSVGIAVDANVLIFERIREELDRGKSVRVSVEEGFKHAMSAIIDSNVSTALTAAVLYQFGTNQVKGFAVTLIAGIAASMVSAIFVVRTFFLLWLNRTRGAQTLSI